MSNGRQLQIHSKIEEKIIKVAIINSFTLSAKKMCKYL
jgi:hypothetical protein